MKIYHNPRCGKSRQTLAILQEKGIKVEIIEYLKIPLTFEELELIITKLEIEPIDLVRKKESEWKEIYKETVQTDEEIINAMVNNPKIIERPIVISGKQGVLGRPPENVLTLLN